MTSNLAINDTTHRHRVRPVRHAGGCGLRIRSPHDECQAIAEPFLIAEVIQDRHGGRTILCHGCGTRWWTA